MNSFLRLLINFLLASILILVFKKFTWIELLNPPSPVADPAMNVMLVSGIIGSLAFMIGEIIDFLFKLLKTVTLGIIGWLLPISIITGFLKLYFASYILTGWFSYSSSLIPLIFMSFLLGIIRIRNN